MGDTPNRRMQTVLVAVGLGLGGYAFAVVAFLAVATLLLAVGVPVLDRPALLLVVSVVTGQGVAFGGFALAYLRRTGRGIGFVSVRVPTLTDFGWTVGGLLSLYGGLVSLSALVSSLGVETASNQISEIGGQNPDVFLLLIPLSFLLIGPGEELLYRGVVQGRLRESFDPGVAIALASLVFAAVHVFALQGQGKVATVAILFLLSLVLGAAYEYTANLVVPALIHGAFNAVQFFIAYSTSTGGFAPS